MVHRSINDGKMQVEPVVHGGKWREASLMFGLAPEEILDYSLNVNPLGPPAAVLDCLSRNLKTIERYPDSESLDLRQNLAYYLGVGVENVVAGNGSMEILHLLLRTLRLRRALIFEPTFGEYRRVAQICGAEVIAVPLSPQECFHLDPDVFIKSLSKAELVFLCNPNNPTGSLITKDVLHELVDACRQRGVFLVVDESFLDFLPDWQELTLCRRAVDVEMVFVLRSLTKLFAMPGLRLGVAVTNSVLASLLNKARDPWNVNILAQMAGEVALKEHAYMENSRALIQREKEYLTGRLAALGLKPFPAAVNFILVDISALGWTAPDLARSAGRRGVLIRDCSSFPGLGPDFIRLAVKDRESNDRLLEVLGDVLR